MLPLVRLIESSLLYLQSSYLSKWLYNKIKVGFTILTERIQVNDTPHYLLSKVSSCEITLTIFSECKKTY